MGAMREVKYRAVFICSPDDPTELEACKATGAQVLVASWPAGPGDFARKNNLGLRMTTEPWLFTGADDLEFHEGWADEVLRVADETGARYIGTCDGGNPAVLAGRHSTHSLIARSYAEELGTIDERGKIFHEGYDHQLVDNEACETAMARGEWAFAADSCVIHLHPFWGKAQTDATYAKGMRASAADRRLFESRRALWR
jgi:hypothetical protein